MSTLTQMTKTPTGWECPQCCSTMEDGILPVRAAECNCEGVEALRGSDDLDWDADPTDPSEAWEREDL